MAIVWGCSYAGSPSDPSTFYPVGSCGGGPAPVGEKDPGLLANYWLASVLIGSRAMTRPPTQSRAVSSPDAASFTRSDWRARCADRRQGFSVFVATLNRMMCDRVTGDGLEAGITAAARCLAPIRTAS